MTNSATKPQAVVIGAGAMGAAVASRLAQSYKLLVADINPQALEALQAQMLQQGYNIQTIVCDVCNVDSVAGLANAVARCGGFRTLVHVTGLSPSMADWQTIMAVNLRGPALVEHALLPLAEDAAAAVFVASLAGHTVSPDKSLLKILDAPLADDLISHFSELIDTELTTTLSYAYSKHGLMRLCERRAAMWGNKNARIVSLSPGLIETPMGQLEFKNNPQKHGLLNSTPLSREGSLAEVCDAIDFLVSDRATFISGTDLLVDGGINAVLKHG